MPTWPGSLPAAPQGDSYQEQAPNTVVRSPMDAGPQKVRRRFTAGVRPFTFTWLLTKAQVATLDTFYNSTLSGGSLTFDGLNHPRTGTATTWRFTMPPTYTYLGPDAWKAITPLEVLP